MKKIKITTYAKGISLPDDIWVNDNGTVRDKRGDKVAEPYGDSVLQVYERACVISAAPDLLKELKGAELTISGMLRHMPDTVNLVVKRQLADMCKAIAKATGAAS